MRQFFILAGGTYSWADEPEPPMFPAALDVQTRASAVSVGTEMGFVRAMKAATQGRRAAGYSAAGVVRGVGPEAKGNFQVGQRVAVYGGPYVRHASRLAVPWTLANPIPDNVSFEEAAFCGIGAIAMHSLRRGAFTAGERVVIVGMGILGQIEEQMLRAWGVRTLCVDRHDENISLARAMGAPEVLDSRKDDVAAAVASFSPGGADGVIMNGNLEPPGSEEAAAWTRERGRIVMVGGGTEIRFPRPPVFDKEIDLLISRAGGPGRYDDQYEKGGQDLPIGFVRWTEGRNCGEFLAMVSAGQINMKGLITHPFPHERAEDAFRLLDSPAKYSAMGVVFTYPE
ncbi:MAG: zinc-binding alcohol dehydrogenase [Phycisphaerae bacterium]|nr:zinc-binding alcohol dehydrogenase [Phycisphaerae bacterium]